MELNIFPAAFNGDRFTVSALHSQSYGPKHGDPHRNSAVVPGDLIEHAALDEWLRRYAQPNTVCVCLIGGPQHGPVTNKPTTLYIQFWSDTQRRDFAKEFGF